MARPDDLGEPYFLPLDVRAVGPLLHTWSLAESHAMFAALIHAWQAPRLRWPPCSIPADRAVLERLLRVSWEDVGDTVRQHFTPHPDVPGFLRCDWLFAQYEAVQAKRTQRSHAARVAGFFSAKAREAKSKPDKDLPTVVERPFNKRKKKNTPSSSYGTGNRPLGAGAPRAAPVRSDGAPPPPEPTGSRTMADVLRYLHEHPDVIHEPAP